MAEQTGKRVSPDEIARRAARVLEDLGGIEPERITGLEPDEEHGWRITLEAVELRRVPETADVIGVYEMTMSNSGRFVGYRQVDRHARGRIEDGR